MKTICAKLYGCYEALVAGKCVVDLEILTVNPLHPTHPHRPRPPGDLDPSFNPGGWFLRVSLLPMMRCLTQAGPDHADFGRARG